VQRATIDRTDGAEPSSFVTSIDSKKIDPRGLDICQSSRPIVTPIVTNVKVAQCNVIPIRTWLRGGQPGSQDLRLGVCRDLEAQRYHCPCSLPFWSETTPGGRPPSSRVARSALTAPLRSYQRSNCGRPRGTRNHMTTLPLPQPERPADESMPVECSTASTRPLLVRRPNSATRLPLIAPANTGLIVPWAPSSQNRALARRRCLDASAEVPAVA
jgi:hypothetical protein